MPMRLASMRESMHALCFCRCSNTTREPRDGGAFTPKLIRNVFGDEAALVHVASHPLLTPRHPRGGRHCWTPAKSTNRHNTKASRAESTKQNAQQDAMKHNKPTVDGIKFATSITCQTSMSHNNRNTHKQMFRTPVTQKLNVGMCVKESVLRN